MQQIVPRYIPSHHRKLYVYRRYRSASSERQSPNKQEKTRKKRRVYRYIRGLASLMHCRSPPNPIIGSKASHEPSYTISYSRVSMRFWSFLNIETSLLSSSCTSNTNSRSGDPWSRRWYGIRVGWVRSQRVMEVIFWTLGRLNELV